MNRFVHRWVRLHTDIDRTWRYFRQPDHLVRWMGAEVHGTPDNQILTFDSISPEIPQWQWHLISNYKRQNCVYGCSGIFGEPSERQYQLEVQLMMGTPKTEYCTEIHLMFRGFDDSESDTLLREQYGTFWAEALERLRFKINGDWVIQDQDLTLSRLMSF